MVSIVADCVTLVDNHANMMEQEFKDFIFREYIDMRNRGWFDEDYEGRPAEEKQDIATYMEYFDSAIGQLSDLFFSW
jgi:hypothetical protein